MSWKEFRIVREISKLFSLYCLNNHLELLGAARR